MQKILFSMIFLLIASGCWAQKKSKKESITLGDPTYKEYCDSLTRLGDQEFFHDGDFNLAVRCYLQAYKKGGVDAAFMLGRCMAEGLGFEQDMEKAIELWSQTAAVGYADGAMKIGECYVVGLGVRKNYAEGFKWYEKAHQLGSIDATYILGSFYYLGQVVEEDIDKAIELWTIAADAGEARSQEALGMLYFDGTKTRRNMLLAVKYLKMAADQGRTKAALYAGLCHEKAYGLPCEDFVSAAYYYMVAADAEVPEAQYRLALLYTDGKGVDQNLDRATYWLQQAQKNGLKLEE